MWYVVFSPTNPNSETRDLQEVARKLALQLYTLRASTERDLDTVFCNRCPTARRGAPDRRRCVLREPERANCRTGGAACDSDDFLYA